MTMNCNAAPEDERDFPATGPRRDEPAICYECGFEIDDPNLFPANVCSGVCYERARDRDRAARRPVDPWLCDGGER